MTRRASKMSKLIILFIYFCLYFILNKILAIEILDDAFFKISCIFSAKIQINIFIISKNITNILDKNFFHQKENDLFMFRRYKIKM
jgi:hypothetical protein